MNSKIIRDLLTKRAGNEKLTSTEIEDFESEMLETSF